MEEGTNTFGSEIWTRDTHVQKNFGRENSYCSYVVRTAGPEKAKFAVKELKNFKSDRNLIAYTEREYYAKMSDTSKQFGFAIYVVAVIMSIGGILGIMNTMYAAISQRGKDIGVLRSMGYRRWQILLSFQLESLLIAILGGVLGCAIAYVCFEGRTATSIMSAGQGGGKSVVLRLTFDFWVLFSGMVFSILMGAVGGFFPSWSRDAHAAAGIAEMTFPVQVSGRKNSTKPAGEVLRTCGVPRRFGVPHPRACRALNEEINDARRRRCAESRRRA